MHAIETIKSLNDKAVDGAKFLRESGITPSESPSPVPCAPVTEQPFNQEEAGC